MAEFESETLKWHGLHRELREIDPDVRRIEHVADAVGFKLDPALSKAREAADREEGNLNYKTETQAHAKPQTRRDREYLES